MAKGGYWASLRSAVAPLFHSAALRGYAPVMHSCIDHLLERLSEAAARGEAVNVHELAGGMTLEVSLRGPGSRQCLSVWRMLCRTRGERPGRQPLRGGSPCA